MKSFSTLILLFVFVNVNAQLTNSNLRSNTIPLVKKKIILDSLTIVHGSLHFFDGNQNIDSKIKYTLEGTVVQMDSISHDLSGKDSIAVTYRVLPLDFSQKYFHIDSSMLEQKIEEVYIAYDLDFGESGNAPPLFQEGLNYDGSFARGLTFGNNQSLVLNSEFNLQLGGKIGDDLEILASISEANIPIQPEGTTQQLQDFDKVFIQLTRKNTQLIAGDYELAKPQSYFINYYKKLQGISVSQSNDLKNGSRLNQKASAAISRGKFSRNFLEIKEGNQGPYKLVGNEGERFLIVLSGTEKVFIDGQLMTRGEENDYVIYYDRAEIVFTTNRLITKDVRVIVEFEYADQRYQRSLIQYEASYQKKSLDLNFSMVSQQDSRNSSGSIPLDSLDRILLSQTGDMDELAIRSGQTIVDEPYNENKIYYKKEFDSNLSDSIFVFTNNPDSAFYQVNFSDVGENNGSYSIDPSVNANGRVYKYVGQGMGNYVPFIRLVAPEQQQMYALQTQYKYSKTGLLEAEFAISHFDLNRLSSFNDDDNLGSSGRLIFRDQFALGKKGKWFLQPTSDIELKSSKFQFFNPYRNPEFLRDWNIDPKTTANEMLANAGFKLSNLEKTLTLDYNFNNFTQTGFYNGNKHYIKGSLKKNGWDLYFQDNRLQGDSELVNTQFNRPKFNISKTFEELGNWSIGVYGEREKNEIRNTGMTGLNENSFYYDYGKAFIRSSSSENFELGLAYNQRIDYSAIPGDFQRSTLAREFELNGKWRSGVISNANWNFKYRKLEIEDENLTPESENAVLLGNLNHILRLWNGAVNSTINYKVSSGQEPKIEFDYRQVLPGEGEYIWVDDGDGIQQRNEFQVSPFKDQANYLRVTLFNNEFIRTNNTGITQSLRIDPAIYFRNQEKSYKMGKLISRFSLVSNYRFENKTQGSARLFSSESFSINDSSLVSYRSLYNGILYFNRGNTKFDSQIGIRNNINKVVQTLGFEERGIQEYYFRNRIALIKQLDLTVNLAAGSKRLNSEVFKNNDFLIRYNKLNGQLSYRYGNAFRLTFEYKLEFKENELGTNSENARVNDFNLGGAYSLERTSRINLSIRYANVQYEGADNSAIELNMLEGLKNGQNILWRIDFSRRVMKNIDLNFSYEGRKTGSNRIIHVGSAQVKSSF